MSEKFEIERLKAKLAIAEGYFLELQWFFVDAFAEMDAVDEELETPPEPRRKRGRPPGAKNKIDKQPGWSRQQ
jgi:hypothetical protein